jgi:hypothetical protein
VRIRAQKVCGPTRTPRSSVRPSIHLGRWVSLFLLAVSGLIPPCQNRIFHVTETTPHQCRLSWRRLRPTMIVPVMGSPSMAATALTILPNLILKTMCQMTILTTVRQSVYLLPHSHHTEADTEAGGGIERCSWGCAFVRQKYVDQRAPPGAVYDHPFTWGDGFHPFSLQLFACCLRPDSTMSRTEFSMLLRPPHINAGYHGGVCDRP